MLHANLQQLIAYAHSSDTSLQREVAEKLANEAVKRASPVFLSFSRCLDRSLIASFSLVSLFCWMEV